MISQWHPGLQSLHNTFQPVGFLFVKSKMHSLHICQTVTLSQTPLHVSSDHTAHETNPPPSAILYIWQRHKVGYNRYRAVLPNWHEMKRGTIHTCAMLCNVKRLSKEVIASDGIVEAISRFSDKTDLLCSSYTTFWRNLLRPSSLLKLWGKQVPQAC